MDHYPIHRGLHVSLGAMRREYIPLFVNGANDPEITKGVLLTPPVTLEAELAWYDTITTGNGRNVIFAILLHERDSYRYIGHTGLHNITYPDAVAISGSIICDKSCFGKGYGKEAKLLLLYEAFLKRGLRKVNSRVKAFNGNSWGHLLACGYRQIGRHKKHHFHNGSFVDSIELEVFREDWENVWKEYLETKTLPRLTNEQRSMLKKETDL